MEIWEFIVINKSYMVRIISLTVWPGLMGEKKKLIDRYIIIINLLE